MTNPVVPDNLVKWANFIAILGAIASGVGLVVSVISAYLWSNGNLAMFAVVVTHINILSSASTAALMAAINFGNLWFYWLLFGEPKGTLSRVFHSSSTFAFALSLMIFPLLSLVSAFMMFVAKLIFKKIQKAKKKAELPTTNMISNQKLAILGSIGAFLTLLTFGLGLISEVKLTFKDKTVISGVGLIAETEVILFNEPRNKANFYQKSEIEKISISSKSTSWFQQPITSVITHSSVGHE